MRIRTAYHRWILPGVLCFATIIILLSAGGLSIYFNRSGSLLLNWSQVQRESLRPDNVDASRYYSRHGQVKSELSAAESRMLLDELDAVHATARLEVDEYEIIYTTEMTRRHRSAQLESPYVPFDSDSLLRKGRIALATGAFSNTLKYLISVRLCVRTVLASDAGAFRITQNNAPFIVLTGYHAIRNGYVRRQNSGRINFFAQSICSSNPQSGGIYLTVLISALQRISFFQSHNSEHADAIGTHIADRRIELRASENQRV